MDINSLSNSAPQTQPTDPNTEALKQAYYQSLLKQTDTSGLPTPTNIISGTVKGIKESHGVIPAILQGITGLAALGGTSAGIAALGQARGGDMYDKMANLSAMHDADQRLAGQKQGLASQEANGIENLSKWGLENTKEQAKQNTASDPNDDPNSQQSKNAQQLAAGLGIDPSKLSTMSANDIKASQSIIEAQARATEAKNKQASEDKLRAQEKEQARTEKSAEQKQKEFEDRRKAIYEANKDKSGAEKIMSAKNDDELNRISISKGIPLPLMHSNVFGGVKSTGPVAGMSPKPGGVLHQDAKGNKAWVYSDGSFDEVK